MNTTYRRRVAAGIAAGTFVTLGFGVAAQADTAQSDAEPMSASSDSPAPAPASPTSERAARQNNIVTLDLYKLTDVHGHISQVSKDGNVTEAGLAAVGCYLDQARAANTNSTFTLLGDNIGASPYVSGSLNDNPTIEALNLLRPDASTIGNHELDMGQEVFKQRVDGSAADQFVQAQFPYLAANVKGMGTYRNDQGEEVPYLGDTKIVSTPSGVKVAFIGAIAQDVPYKLSPKTTEGLTFEDPIAAVNDLAGSLKSSGQADVVIAMLDDDVKNNFPKMGKNVDGLMGGDTHVPYDFDMVDGAEGNKLSAVASGSYTDNLGVLHIQYDTAKNTVVESSADLIPASEIAQCGEDPDIKDVVTNAEKMAKEKGQSVVATIAPNAKFSRGVFDKAEGESAGPGSNRGIESTLGGLAADAMRHAVTTPDGEPVDIGMINAGGLRADLQANDKGEITYASTFAVMPFSNQIGYVTLKGSDIKQALEQQWKTNLNSQNSRPMLKLGLSSNVSYTYDPAKPYGERITSVVVNGAPIDESASYTVGSVTFLLSGGDSFDALTSGGEPVISQGLDRDCFNEYLKAHEGELAPRALKGSVGLSLSGEAVPNNSVISIDLRGLSFSEGPGITDTVTVSAGSQKATAKVNNSLVEPQANTEASIITTDGAGQAQVELTAQADCSATPGQVVELPLTVSTDAGDVVTAANGLVVRVSCPAAQRPVEEGKAPAGAPQTGKIARTGATDSVAIAALVLAGVGAALTMRRHRA